MRRHSTAFLAAALTAATWLSGAAPAAADGPLPEEARRRAEDAFALGLLEEVEAALAGATTETDREPLRVLDLWWRPGPPVAGETVKDPDSLAGRRLAWALSGGRAAYPAPKAGETDPYPLLTALVLDRQRREEKGSTRLLQESPLLPLAPRSDQARYFLEMVLKPVILGPASLVPPDAAPDSARVETRALAGRNAKLAVAAAAALAAVGALLFLLARPLRRRDRAPPSAPSGGGAIGGGAPPPP